MPDPADRASPGSIHPDPVPTRRRVPYRPDAPDSPYLSRILQIVREEFGGMMIDAEVMDQRIASVVRRVEGGS